MRPAARPVRRWRPGAAPAAIVLILCAGLLAACSGTTLPFSKSSAAPLERTPPPIFVGTMSGLSTEQTAAMFDALVSAAGERGISLGGGEVENEYALVGEFEAVPTDAGSSVRYSWTLTDASGRVLHRIEESEPARALTDQGPTGQGPGGVDGLPVTRIAAYTAESLSSRFSQLGYATRAAGMPPPLDHLVQAGSSAEQEIDFETLHGPGMAEAASAGPPDLRPSLPEQASDATVLAQSDSQPRSAGSHQSIEGVAIGGVNGAGKAGNGELTDALVRVLTDAGWPVKQEPNDNVLTIHGDVSVGEPNGKDQKVILRWTVSAPDGQVLGAVEQANDVPAGSLDNGWGAAADHAAVAAAQGIFDLVDKLR